MFFALPAIPGSAAQVAEGPIYLIFIFAGGALSAIFCPQSWLYVAAGFSTVFAPKIIVETGPDDSMVLVAYTFGIAMIAVLSGARAFTTYLMASRIGILKPEREPSERTKWSRGR